MIDETRPARALWLSGAEVPAQWTTAKVKHLVKFASGFGITAESIESDGPYPVYGANGLRGFSTAYTHSGRRVLVGRVGALCGNVHSVDGFFWASEHALVGKISSEIDHRWLAYLLQAMNLGQYSQSTAQPVIAASTIENLDVEVPDLTEQRCIADFLDGETTRIDALIGEQQGLVGLLRERRAATITRAVTKGLNPDTDYVETGVASLGRIPSHWSVKRVKHLGRAIIGLTYSPDDVVDREDGGTLVLRAGNIQNGRLLLEDNVYVSSPVPPTLRTRPGDILICARNGSAHLVGKCALVEDEAVGESWGAFMAVLRSPSNFYLRWILNSQLFTAQIGMFSTSTINQLTSSALHNLEIAVPPLEEQRQIADYLLEQTGKIDALIAEAEGIVAVAKERRTALITAAVTGQLVVRGEVA